MMAAMTLEFLDAFYIVGAYAANPDYKRADICANRLSKDCSTKLVDGSLVVSSLVDEKHYLTLCCTRVVDLLNYERFLEVQRGTTVPDSPQLWHPSSESQRPGGERT